MRQEIAIDKVGQFGQGVGHDGSGNVYFVPGAVPGDVVVIEHEGGKRYRDASLVEVVSPSPARRTPECRHFTDCGGCDWLHWSYEEQLKAKDAMVSHVLERAGLKAERRDPILAAAAQLGYRNRIQVRRDGSRLGFFRRRSHDIVDIESCPVAHPSINEALTKLRAEAPGEGMHKFELSVDENGGVALIQDVMHSATGFVQVNPAQNLVLRSEVAGAVRAGEPKQVLELYAGNGNLTFAYLASLPQIEKVIACDSSRAALASAREYRDRLPTEIQGRVALIEANVDRALTRSLPPDFRKSYDTLVVDPPRTGFPALADFLHPKLRNIVYVSCAPLTFVSDVQCLKEDFRLESVRALDMFPNTRHVEMVARFSRISPSVS